MSDASKNPSHADYTPWLAMAGWLKDDPLYEAWQAEICDYRREFDRDEGIALQEKAE